MFRLASVTAALCLLGGSALAAEPTPESVRAFLAKHCIECHGPTAQKGDLRLDNLATDFTAEAGAKWKSVHARIAEGTMPPAKKPKPAKAELDGVTAWLMPRLATGERNRQKAEGRVVMRRLNRVEYENTIRDLLGVHVDVKELLPADAVTHSFDNIGEALNVSAVQMQRYLEAAELALNAAVVRNPQPKVEKKTVTLAEGRAASNIGRHWLKRPDGTVVVFTSGTFPSTQIDAFRAPVRGRYTVTVRAYAYQSKKPITYALYAGNFGRGGDTMLLGYFEAAPDKPTPVTVHVALEPGDSLQAIPYKLQGFNVYKKENPDKPEAYPGPGFALVGVDVEGPMQEVWPPRGHTRLFGDLPLKPMPAPKFRGPQGRNAPTLEVESKNPASDARRLLPGFLSWAFRRPVTPAQAATYIALFDSEFKSGGNFREAMLAAATAALCSPDFLFLRETPGKLDDFALASRLSYFLWRTMPDEELIRLAVNRELSKPAVLRAQTERLLKHPNAARFTKDFTDAWLDLRNIDFTTPDRILYPEFDALLQESMVKETRAFFDEVLGKNLPASTFIASDFAMLNDRLAKHYGLPDVDGLEIRRVPLPAGSHRGGVLTQGAVLKVSANGTSTSPVVRGVYVLERFLGTTPPPPPPGVPAVEPDIRGAKTVRDLLAKHRSIETCAGCHRLIDPPGFALEEFDVIGGHREKFRAAMMPGGRGAVPGTRYKLGLPVDSSGELNDGRSFKNFEEFRKLLLGDPDRFARCLIEKLLTFATGQDVGLAEHAEVNRMVAESAAKKHNVRDLVHTVIQSELFRTK